MYGSDLSIMSTAIVYLSLGVCVCVWFNDFFYTLCTRATLCKLYMILVQFKSWKKKLLINIKLWHRNYLSQFDSFRLSSVLLVCIQTDTLICILSWSNKQTYIIMIIIDIWVCLYAFIGIYTGLGHLLAQFTVIFLLTAIEIECKCECVHVCICSTVHMVYLISMVILLSSHHTFHAIAFSQTFNRFLF